MEKGRNNPIPEGAPGYAQTLKDIRNMLFFGAAGVLSVPLTSPLFVSESHTPESFAVRAVIGFSMGVVVGLPAGRLFKL